MTQTIYTTLFCFLLKITFAQVDYTANNQVLPYEEGFRAGMNFDAYRGFTEVMQANLAAGNPELELKGIGAKTVRPALYEEYFSFAGYEAQLSNFQHFDAVDLKDNTVIVGFPSAAKRDPNFYCDQYQSTLFANLYEPIWDGGANGTPYNDANDYAAYLYRTVEIYGDYVKFWEIWNEPGFDFTKNRGWLNPGQEGNWWDNDPDPCDYKLRAPIQHYVRLLRVSYEVIKSLQPDDYVVVSGTGYMSFLDAILRNTDNPDGGAVTADFPLGGGAYFDVMGFHSYPHFDGSLREYSDELEDFIQYRHSDAAAEGIGVTQDSFQAVLANYGYDGMQFPKKEWIVTECNLPRVEFDGFIGSNEAQRNFMPKAMVTCMQRDIHQLHLYKLADDTEAAQATFEFDLMGMYQKLDLGDGYFQQKNDAGIAYATATELLFNHTAKEIDLEAFFNNENIGGGKFIDEFGSTTYVLWAKTDTDQSEEANATISFPESSNIISVTRREWDYSSHHKSQLIDSQSIELTGSPSYFTVSNFSSTTESGCVPLTIDFQILNPQNYFYKWTFTGAASLESTAYEPRVIFNRTGKQTVTLQAFDQQNNLIYTEQQFIHISAPARPDFTYRIDGPQVYFTNTSGLDHQDYEWDFGDGTTSKDGSPLHVYYESGMYNVTLTMTNDCGQEQRTAQIFINVPSTTQTTTTADDEIKDYPYPFRAGSNFKFYQNWSDEQLADIAAGNKILGVNGAGVKSLRSMLPHYFLENWGYGIRSRAFRHYKNLALENNTLIVGAPSEASREVQMYCPDEQALTFKNLYLDIWDNGENGTPINDRNDYALYIYKTVETYKDFITFWEIYNSPGFDLTSEKGYLPPGEAGNWWDHDPDPCDYEFRAPIEHYIRTLRISYEVIKTLDPDGFVTLSGVGFPSFLDAILRNTDNPLDGSVAPGYEKTGGAYFDAVGYNTYPSIDGSTSYFDLDASAFAYERHSDAAVSGIGRIKNELQSILTKYGYDGEQRPEKLFLIGESNISRGHFGESIGGEIAQRNFTIKAYVEAVKNDLKQFHIQSLAEDRLPEHATGEGELMGLYQTLENVQPYQQQINAQGIAYKTVSDILYGLSFDQERSFENDSISVNAFHDVDGNYVYALWAKTMIDRSEVADFHFEIPENWTPPNLIKRDWNWSATNEENVFSESEITLNGTPIFLMETTETIQPPIATFLVIGDENCENTPLDIRNFSTQEVEYEWHFIGGEPAMSNLEHPVVTYATPGNYPISLTVRNAAGSHTYTLLQEVEIAPRPQLDFEFEIMPPMVQFTNTSTDLDNWFWDFGNGDTGVGYSPAAFYIDNGTFEVTLIGSNECGSDTLTRTVVINNMPTARFMTIPSGGCDNLEVRFLDQSTFSPTSWEWTIPNATPAISTEQNPLVTFLESGTYDIQLIIRNDFGSDTLVQSVMVGGVKSDIDFTLCAGEILNYEGHVFDESQPAGQIVYEDVTAQGCDSTLFIKVTFLEEIITEVFDTLEMGNGGTFYDILTSVNGCDSLVIRHVTILTTDIAEIENDIQIWAFPNPFLEIVEFEVNGTSFSDYTQAIEIYGLDGMLVATVNTHELGTSRKRIKWNSRYISAGVYFAKIKTDVGIKMLKLVKL